MKKNRKRTHGQKSSVFIRLYNYLFFIAGYLFALTLQIIQSYRTTKHHNSPIISDTTITIKSAENSQMDAQKSDELEKLKPVVSEVGEDNKFSEKPNISNTAEQVQPMTLKSQVIVKSIKSQPKPNKRKSKPYHGGTISHDIKNTSGKFEIIEPYPEMKKNSKINEPKKIIKPGNREENLSHKVEDNSEKLEAVESSPKPKQNPSINISEENLSHSIENNPGKLEAIEPPLEAEQNPAMNTSKEIINLHTTIPREILHLICTFLDKNSKLNLRLVCKDLSKKMTIGNDHNSFFTPINKFKFLHNIIGNNNEGPLSSFNIEMASPNLLAKLKNEIKKFLLNQTLKNDSIEKKILSYIKDFLLDKDGEINDDALKNSITGYRHYLYRNNFIKYRVVFHVEKEDSIGKALYNWIPQDESGLSSFSVDSYTTFFYSKKQVTRFGFLKEGYILSMLVLPASMISDNMEYSGRTAFERRPLYYSAKKSYIGNSTFYIDPGFLVAIFKTDKEGKITEGRINANRHLGIDIAIKPEEAMLDKAAIEQYLSNVFDTELEVPSGLKIGG